MEAMGVSIKSGCPVGRASSSLATGTGEAKQVNRGKLFGACCGVAKAKLPLSEWVFNCGACSLSIDCDANLAVNILVAGSAPETLNARGGAVRRGSPSGYVALVPVKREPSGRRKAL